MTCGEHDNQARFAAKLQQQILALAAALAADESRNGFSPAEWLALSHLASLATDVELTLTELARRTATSKSNASRAVQRLVTAGLAECEIVSDNRRQRAIRITAEGRLAQQAAKPSARTGARAAIEALPAEDAATLERILGVCLQAVDRI